MVKVHERLYVGDEGSCRQGSPELAVAHACKSPCHQRSVGYKGSLAQKHPQYLALQHSHDLYLNIIDPPLPLFRLETFSHFLSFAEEHHGRGGSLLVHCNQGESRSPSLALLFLAKRLGAIPGESFPAAEAAFVTLYAKYRPGQGIRQSLTEKWGLLD
ncbi:dual specificity protein phosphatase family protein [Acidipila rosea]|uniref:Dual specificity protein phosphatase-like protein n=1 Tax=Acidipila rosea TaxID=768535 RepID=A0A4R1LBL6_9BACT|nr:dual specificity protein phosphatase family protein [Acidipila rosea]TCK73889.1 dual specificity protein phosphatase-like protein [Acidipila rosea]